MNRTPAIRTTAAALALSFALLAPAALAQLPDRDRLAALAPEIRPSVEQALVAVEQSARDTRPNALAELGQLLFVHGLAESGIQAMEAAVAGSPRADWVYLLAYMYGREARPGEALERLEPLLAHPELGGLARLRSAEALIELGRNDEAQRTLEAAVDPSLDAYRHYLVAQAAIGQRDWERAATALERALELQAGATSLHYALAQAQTRLGQRAAAGRSLERAGEGKLALPDATVGRMLRLRDGLLARLQLAESALQAGRVDEAEAGFLAVLALDPRHAGAQYNLGVVALQKRNPTAALERFRAAVDIHPDYALAWLNMAGVLSRSGRIEDADRAYARALELQPADWATGFNRANHLRRSGRPAEAADAFRSLTERHPEQAAAWQALLITELSLGRYAQAQAAALDAIDRHRDANLQLWAARLLAANPVEALRRPQQALALADPLLGTALRMEALEVQAAALISEGRVDEARSLQAQMMQAATTRGDRRWMARVRTAQDALDRAAAPYAFWWETPS